MYNIFLFFILSLFLVGCSTKGLRFEQKLEGTYEATQFENLPTWQEQDFQKSLEVFQSTCAYSKRYAMFQEVCTKAKKAVDAKAFFENNFQAFYLLNKQEKKEGLITGYFEPLLKGSRVKSERFAYPVYGVPKDLITVRLEGIYPELRHKRLLGRLKGNELRPYFSREEIEREGIKAEVLCYVDNKVDLFFLQVQGSGKVQLEDGSVINVGYAAQNGRRYTSIGKYFLEKKLISRENLGLESIQTFLEENEAMQDTILNLNKSYVFFKESKQGATGALGLELFATHSLATDKRVIPLGSPVFMQTTHPVSKKAINKLMFAHDVGGAIKGAVRADFFWGFGQEAKKAASDMKAKGKLVILLPNEFLKEHNAR